MISPIEHHLCLMVLTGCKLIVGIESEMARWVSKAEFPEL